MKIPMVDLVAQYKTIRKEIDNVVKEVIESGWFIMGPNVKAFEEEMAEYCGTKYAIACASGTDALMMGLMAMDIQPGDEVITTPFTFAATAEVVALLGVRAVFVDIDSVSYNIDVKAIKNAITQKTKAIIPVHLYGQPADMDEITELAKDNNLIVIEDACQAVGAKYKGNKACSMGNMGCLSFFPAKNLGAYGDGGMILTSDEELNRKLCMIRDHGSDRRYHHAILGLNSRLDALQAAILRVKLKYIDDWNEARKDRAALYTELLRNAAVQVPTVLDDRTHVFHQYTLRVKNRDGLREFLQENGIASAIHYPIPLHMQPAFHDPGQAEGNFPIAEGIARDVISLPMYPELTEEAIQFIASKIIEFTSE